MCDLGCKSVTCLDIGEEWQPVLEDALISLDIPKTFYSFCSGSVTSIPLPDESFDFVCSNGVIMHLDGIEEAEKAISEMGRVTKKGGTLYIYVGVSEPGIVDRYILPALRQAYKEDIGFKRFVDSIETHQLQENFMRYVEIARKEDSAINAESYEAFFKLFTLDTCTFIKNCLQVPVQQGPKLSMDWASQVLKKNGFSNIKRIPTAYWKRQDVRKYLAPLHFDTTNPLTQLFYGDGHIKLIAEKC